MAFNPYRQAIYYLARYATSKEKLRAYLTRKANEKLDELPADWHSELESLLLKLQEMGYINDHHYGEARLRRYGEQGYAYKVIRQKLKQDGLDDAVISSLMAKQNEDEACTDEDRAREYIKSKRIGPYRVLKSSPNEEEKRKLYQRDLASLARRGFSYEIARKLLNETIDSCE